MATSVIGQETLDRLYAVIESELGIDPRRLDAKNNFIFDLGLDSVQLAAVATRIDVEFGIDMPLMMLEVTTLHDFLEVFAEQIRLKSSTPAQ